MLPDIVGLDRTFDYLVPESWAIDRGEDPRARDAGAVGVGSIVRVVFSGRRVRGWVVEVDIDPAPGVRLDELKVLSGIGPDAETLELAHWAADRWAGRPVHLLRAASPMRNVRRLPARRNTRQQPVDVTAADPAVAPEPRRAQSVVAEAFAGPPTLVRLPPAADPFPYVRHAASLGQALIVTAVRRDADALIRRLRTNGLEATGVPDGWPLAAAGVTVVGARAAAWAPTPDLAAVLVLDEHDETHQEERSPTWHARDVALERARRADVPVVLLTPSPSLEAEDATERQLRLSRADEREGWPVVEVVDRRDEDPGRPTLLSPRLASLLGRGGSALCVLNRKGRAQLLACAACRAIVRCDKCESAGRLDDTKMIVCGRCDQTRPGFCADCGSTTLRLIRPGVTRIREELEALIGETVDDITAGSDIRGSNSRVKVGTEAVLHGIDRVDVVAFLDLDQELLHPHVRSAERALGLLARAARLVGPRSGSGRLLLQTSLPDHEVVRAAVHGDPSLVSDKERVRRNELLLPPVTAMAAISGPGAEAAVTATDWPPGIEVLHVGERHLVRADGRALLTTALRSLHRSGERVRVEVDPLRI